MVRDSKKRDKKKESEFVKFVKKRAPIYIAVAAIVVIFVIPELTKKDLQSHFPEDMVESERQVLDTLMEYKGSDGNGLSVIEAVTEKINAEYPDEKIYDSKKTSVDLVISKTGDSGHQVLLNFKSHKGEMDYSWNVNSDGQITGNNSKAKHIIDLVEFYD